VQSKDHQRVVSDSLNSNYEIGQYKYLTTKPKTNKENKVNSPSTLEYHSRSVYQANGPRSPLSNVQQQNRKSNNSGLAS
jgi:hypothetical protein